MGPHRGLLLVVLAAATLAARAVPTPDCSLTLSSFTDSDMDGKYSVSADVKCHGATGTTTRCLTAWGTGYQQTVCQDVYSKNPGQDSCIFSFTMIPPGTRITFNGTVDASPSNSGKCCPGASHFCGKATGCPNDYFDTVGPTSSTSPGKAPSPPPSPSSLPSPSPVRSPPPIPSPVASPPPTPCSPSPVASPSPPVDSSSPVAFSPPPANSLSPVASPPPPANSPSPVASPPPANSPSPLASPPPPTNSPTPVTSPAPNGCTSVFFSMPRSPASSSSYLAYAAATAAADADAFCRFQPGGFGGAGAFKSLVLPDSFAAQASRWVTQKLRSGQACTGAGCEAFGVIECVPAGRAPLAVDGMGNVGCRNSGTNNIGNDNAGRSNWGNRNAGSNDVGDDNSGSSNIGNRNQVSGIFGDDGTPYAV